MSQKCLRSFLPLPTTTTEKLLRNKIVSQHHPIIPHRRFYIVLTPRLLPSSSSSIIAGIPRRRPTTCLDEHRGGWRVCNHHKWRRFESTSSSISPPKKKSGYPERLLIYYGGTAKSVFIGCLKITTIYLFALSVFYIIPGYLWGPEKDWVMIGIALIAGTLPMLFIAYITKPYVLYMHINLPHYARRSQDILTRFTRTLPPETELDMTTMHFSGRPRFTRVKVSELIEARARLGVANLVRLPKRVAGGGELAGKEETRRWWRWFAFKTPVKEFYVAPSSAPSSGAGRKKDTAGEVVHGVWENVLGCVRRGSWGGRSAY